MSLNLKRNFEFDTPSKPKPIVVYAITIALYMKEACPHKGTKDERKTHWCMYCSLRFKL